MGEAPAYEGVEATSVELVSLSGLPLAGGKVEVLPIAGGLVGLDAFASDLLYEQSADRQGAVPDEFGIHAEAGLTGVVAVAGIVRGEGSARKGTLAVGLGGDDFPDQGFDVPFAVPEPGCQMVEQFGVGRRFALST